MVAAGGISRLLRLRISLRDLAASLAGGGCRCREGGSGVEGGVCGGGDARVAEGLRCGGMAAHVYAIPMSERIVELLRPLASREEDRCGRRCK